MSFFKKALASVGIGGTKIDAQFSKSNYVQGETADGVVVIQGGKVDQHIDELKMTFCVKAWYESDDKKVSTTLNIETFSVGSNINVKAGERLEIPFSVRIPNYTPKTSKKSPVWVFTGADIPKALDPSDRDYLDIVEHVNTKKFLDIVRNMGFRLREVEVEKDSNRARRFFGNEGINVGFVQEYEWTPSTEFRGKLDEIEALFFANDSGLKVWLTKDRKLRGLSSLFENDESTFEVRFSSNELDNRQLIESRIRQILQ